MGEVFSFSPSEIYHRHHRESLPPERIFAGNVVKVPVGTAHPEIHIGVRRSFVLYRKSAQCYHDSVGTADPRVLHLRSNPIEATAEHHNVAVDGHLPAPLVDHFFPSRMGMPMVD